ncbi:BtrH N-terminal domain-containing protein [Actinacidiphila bryophytorum]|uniref:BtrH N-terminal domain-containing protein n=1 Tax=Actinacidiphila bryophytorum TaxID=1436133 RepID=UPI002176EC74|nr:BtrH N-terminal domain-containing protein [Actinacidiphila bryophytorum]UWE08645.1 BtrH N-terminal domain-containing protein [Actinacidiphila bryophytorum]
MDHRPMFARAWGFGFRDRGWDAYSCLGERVHPGKSNPMTALPALVTDVECTEVSPASAEEALDLLSAETAAGRPAVLSVDSFDCPWDPGYQTYHQPHFTVVTGLSGADGDLLCTDFFFGKQNVVLPARDWAHSLGTVLACARSGSPPLTPHEVAAEVLAHSSGGHTAMATHLSRFAAAVEAGFDLATEFHGHAVAWWNAPLFDGLLKAAHGRALAAEALDVAGAGLTPALVVEGLDRAAAGWRQLRMMLLRAGRSAEPAPVMRRARDLVLRLRDDECDMLAELYAAVQGGGDRGAGAAEGATPCTPVPLARLGGSRIFGCPHHPGTTADGYLAAYDLPADPELAVAPWHFQLPDLRVDTGDHLVPGGPPVALPGGRHDRLAMLATAAPSPGARVTVHYDHGPAAQLSPDVEAPPYVVRRHTRAGDFTGAAPLHPLAVPLDGTRTATALELWDGTGSEVVAVSVRPTQRRSDV